MSQIREPDELSAWWRPGTPPGWVTSVIALASAITVAIAYLGAHRVVEFGNNAPPAWWVRDGLAIGLAATLAASWLLPWRLARSLRVALVLPIAHAVGVGAAWIAWRHLRLANDDAAAAAVLTRIMPLAWVALGGGALTAAIARVIAGRRREWLHAGVMVSLVHLLLAGAWYPIAAQVVGGHPRTMWDTWADVAAGLGDPHLLVLLFVPPLVATAGISWIAFRHPEAARQRLGGALAMLGPLLVGACVTRNDARPDSALIYANVIHVELALGLIAVAAIAGLGASLLVRERRIARAIGGGQRAGVAMVEPGVHPAIAWFYIDSWLRGPRAVTAGFVLRTSAGELAVPAGSELCAALPALSTRLTAGDAIVALSAGDRVQLAGFVDADVDHPFRAAGTIAGERGLRLAPERGPRAGMAGVALALWRPCVVYLAVVVAVALPGLVAALTTQ